MTRYEFWQDTRSREIWAVKLLDGIVVGCAGPLHRDDVDDEFLAGLDYSEKGAASIEAQREEFAVFVGA